MMMILMISLYTLLGFGTRGKWAAAGRARSWLKSGAYLDIIMVSGRI
jgi:hypothetical protein